MPINNLPFQPTSFVGREKELAEIAALLADPNCRLLTLVGAGGIGKTRLALQAAEDQQPGFADGIAFVPLAPVGSPDLLPSAIAGALEVSFFGSEEPNIQLVRYLREKHMLLVMDNFEHLLDGTNLLTDLLHAAPNLKILATSRERLNLQEEWGSILDGLSYPTESSLDSPEKYGAVQLFIQRASQVNTHFSLTENTQAVLSICRQVEGMPLGLELAASWLRAMSCQQIVDQMTHDLDFLTTPLRNIPERHRSLRAVFTQSWNMLSKHEKDVLMKLSIFHGGFDLDAAIHVAGASLLLLASLVDKSLIRIDSSGRYDMHELLRQYADEKLIQSGKFDAIVESHLNYFIQLAEEAESHLFSSQQIPWFNRLEVEMDNFRAAFTYGSESESGLRLAVALGWFFSECSYWKEGLDWFERTLAANPNAPTELRAKAFHLAGGLAGHFGDEARLHSYCQQAIEIGKATDNKTAIAWSLCHLGFYFDHDLEQASLQLQESVRLFRETGDSMGMAHCLNRLAWTALAQNNLVLARQYTEEAALLSEQAGDTIMLGWVSSTLGRIAGHSHDFEAAREFFKQSAAQFSQARLPDGVNLMLISLADIEFKLGNLNEAERVHQEALRLPRGMMLNHPGLPFNLAGLAHIALLRGEYERSARLLAAAHVDWLVEDSIRFPQNQPFEQNKAIVRAHMGEDAFNTAWAEGKAMTVRQAEDYALEGQAQPAKLSDKREQLSSDLAFHHSLTDREREILHLMTHGLNSREIADRLILSAETIRWYLKQIYSKLDAHSRSEAIARARDLKILN